MNWLPKYRAGPVEFWLGEAFTEFVNGFIAGWKHGVGTGAGTGVLTGGVIPGTEQIPQSMTAWQQILVSAGATVLAMVMNGITQMTDWHKTNPFPNPWGKPTGNTPAPFDPPSAK